MRSIFATFCTVIEARDGIEALEIIERQTPDLIISDVMMPRLDGFGLMLTARGGEDNKIEGLLAGADGKLPRAMGRLRNSHLLDYLGKPFNARELIARGMSCKILKILG